MEHITTTTTTTIHNNNSVSSSILDGEMVHWLRCVQNYRRMNLTLNPTSTAPTGALDHALTSSSSSNALLLTQSNPPPSHTSVLNHENHRSLVLEEQYQKELHLTQNEPIYNGIDTFHLFFEGRRDIPHTTSDDDNDNNNNNKKTMAERRYFGPNCCHRDSIIRTELLYCPCVATIEPLDPLYVFRDALLTTLLTMQQQHHHHQQQQQQGGGEEAESSSSESNNYHLLQPLIFSYKSIVKNAHLSSISQSVLTSSASSSNSKPTNIPSKNIVVNQRRLYVNTFRQLRNDGILYLTNESLDEYMLLSKSHVLIPYYKQILNSNNNSTMLEKQVMKSNPPLYLHRVPKGRKQLVMKLCHIALTKKKSK